MDNLTDREQMLFNELDRQLGQAKSQADYSSKVSSIVAFILLMALMYVAKDSGWTVFLGLLIVFLVCEKVVEAIRLRKFKGSLERMHDEFLHAILEGEKKQADL